MYCEEERETGLLLLLLLFVTHTQQKQHNTRHDKNTTTHDHTKNHPRALTRVGGCEVEEGGGLGLATGVFTIQRGSLAGVGPRNVLRGRKGRAGVSNESVYYTKGEGGLEAGECSREDARSNHHLGLRG